jgi:hypothetical protein
VRRLRASGAQNVDEAALDEWTDVFLKRVEEIRTATNCKANWALHWPGEGDAGFSISDDYCPASKNTGLCGGVWVLPPIDPALSGASRSITSLSLWFVPCVTVLVVVVMDAIAPASQMLTYTRLLSAAAVANKRNRVDEGEYTGTGLQAVTSGTAYWPTANGGEVNSESSEPKIEDEADRIAKVPASKTVTIGMMQEPVPAFGSEHGDCVW